MVTTEVGKKLEQLYIVDIKMGKINIKKRFIKYWTDKPKSDFWMWAFITLLIFRYFTPAVLILTIPFYIGLVAPDTQVNYQPIAANMTQNFIIPMEKLNEVGSKIAQNNPLIAKILFYLMGYLVYVVWISMLLLSMNLFRYGVSYIYKKSRHSQKQSKRGYRGR